MSTGTTKAPNLPIAPVDYSQQYQDQLNNVLRLYFSQLDNPGVSAASTLRTGNTIFSAMNFSEANATNARVLSLPNQTELANLRVGDVYVDLSAGNVLKVKV
jgi:hypothetical protein